MPSSVHGSNPLRESAIEQLVELAECLTAARDLARVHTDGEEAFLTSALAAAEESLRTLRSATFTSAEYKDIIGNARWIRQYAILGSQLGDMDTDVLDDGPCLRGRTDSS